MGPVRSFFAGLSDLLSEDALRMALGDDQEVLQTLASHQLAM
jgi:hypothetical protein